MRRLCLTAGLFFYAACGPAPDEPDSGALGDGATDAHPSDSAIADATPSDAELTDGLIFDATMDASPVDADPSDTVPSDADPVDANPGDANPGDASPNDAIPTDANPNDAGPADAFASDVGAGGDAALDAGPGVDGGAGDSGTCPANGNWTSLELPHYIAAQVSPQLWGVALSGNGRYVAFSADWGRYYTPFLYWTDPPNVSYYGVFRYDLLTGEQINTDVDTQPHGVSLTFDGVTVLTPGHPKSRVSDDGLVQVNVDASLVDSVILAPSGVTGPVCRRGTFPFGHCNGSADEPRISADGRYVVFLSWASDISFFDLDQTADAYLLDRVTGTTEVVTADPITGFALNQSFPDDLLDISVDGNLVYYTVGGSVMIWDRTLGTRTPGSPPLWRQACGSMLLDRCQASRDGTTRMVYGSFLSFLTGTARVERTLLPPPMIPCTPRTTDLERYYFQARAPRPINVPAYAPVWTGTEMLSWGQNLSGAPGAVALLRHDPSAQTWAIGSSVGQPNYRIGYSGTWLGDRYLIWGGEDGTGQLQSGYSYSPSTDSWSPISSAGAPSARIHHGSVWTGQYYVVFGGYPLGGDLGGRYDPATDTWLTMSTIGAPAPLLPLTNGHGPQLAWSGTEVLLWTGAEIGRYDPVGNVWLAVTPTDPPTVSYPDDSYAAWVDGYFWIISETGAFAFYDPITQGLSQTPAGDFLRVDGLSGFGFSTGDDLVVSGSPAFAFGSTDVRPVLWADDGETPVWTGSELIMRGGVWAPPP